MIRKEYVPHKDVDHSHDIRLTNADGRDLAPLGTITLKVNLGNLETDQSFTVVENLSAPAILGCDFLKKEGIVIDFQKNVFSSYRFPTLQGQLGVHQPSVCTLVPDNDYPQAIPHPTTTLKPELDMPTDYHPSLKQLLKEHSMIFRKTLGKTLAAQHIIDTGNSQPVKVPPRPIPFHFADRVHKQLQEMADEGIIQPSNSPWCAPAVYVPKPNGEIRICVDFVQLNRVTKKDSYPVPRADGPQQKLADKRVFSKIDLRSAYWQFPMERSSIEKTAFCPGPGYGLWEFTVMPYGLTGATQTCQRGLDKVLKDCKYCIDNYVDDCIIFSEDLETHIQDLGMVLGKLQAAGFTLRGSKCFFGKSEISHLGFEYSAKGVKPTKEKTQTIQEWPIPQSVKDVRSFLGLANFYRRFVPKFADTAAPLTDLTGNKATFVWQDIHQQAFEKLKQALVSPPLIAYPTPQDKFILTTDASDIGLGAILSTKQGTVIEYASRTLTPTEKNYATIEKECLAIVWAVRKFRHYLIGAHFVIHTDHKPLEWLESSKTSKARSQRLERWSLELRAFDFDIVHLPGSTNLNADALSRRPIAVVGVTTPISEEEISAAQKNDSTLSLIYELVEKKGYPSQIGKWSQFPLKRYRQIWSQLTLKHSVLCREVASPTMTDTKHLIIVPRSLQKLFLKMAHEDSGHQGMERTLSRLSDVAYWVGMAKSVIHHCKVCVKCQFSKAPPPKPVPLQPVLATRPWEMVAVDVLKVPMSTKGNQYLLVAQDYFSKWPFAKPMPDQKAERIVQILKDEVFTVVGPPQKLHSDQGRNFESRLLGDLCKAFGVSKSHTTPYHPMGDGLVERMNRSLLSLLRTYVERENLWEEHLQLLLFVYRTTKHSSTGFSPFEVLLGSNPPLQQIPNFYSPLLPEPSDYCEELKNKLALLREMVDANLVESADKQQHAYKGSVRTPLKPGQQVLLSNPIAGKLDPRWTGPWTVKQMKGPSTVTITMENSTRAVHINRVRPLLIEDSDSFGVKADWTPPLFHHEDIPENNLNNNSSPTKDRVSDDNPDHTPSVLVHHRQNDPEPYPVITTRSGRIVKPVQRYGRHS